MHRHHLKVDTMNVRNLLSSRLALALLAAILYVAGKSLAQFLGLDDPAAGFFSQAPGLGDAGLLLVWAVAHCDTLDGPVVAAARKALDTGNVNLVLIWVQKKDEAEIRNHFQKTVAVRKVSAQAKELADMYFFETLVRLHRAGEGAAYTGLKPAGKIEPPIAAADKALESGKVEGVVKLVSERMHAGLERHFKEMISKKKYNPDDIAAGRAFASAYVEYTHYVERLYDASETLAPGRVQKEAPGMVHSH